MSKILLIDDDYQITDLVQEVLSRNGYVVDAANAVEDAQEMLAGFTYDLIILDWVMPGMHGIDLLAGIRARGLMTPVLMLTGMDSINHKVQGLETGADDYLAKPFNKQELVARVRALLRRPAQALATDELSFSGVTMNTKTLKVTWHGQEIKLTSQEHQLLELLMRHKNEVFNQEALVQRAWSSLSESSSDTVRTHMSRLRKKFEDGPAPCPIKTVYGKGYVFVAEE